MQKKNYKNCKFVTAKKSLGQNFCKDERIPAEIIEKLDTGPEFEVWEIGPGKGALTQELLKTGTTLTAFEIDKRLQEQLLEDFPDVTFIWNDFLSIPPEELPKISKPLLVCGNLPYYCGTPIIKRFLENGPKAERLVFLLQEEVSKKAASAHNNKEYGYLSVHTQFFAKASIGNTYPPSSFVPQPKINSTILLLEPYSLTEDEINIRKKTLKYVSTLFHQKRKMALPLLKKRFPAVDWQTRFEKLSIDEKARPENIAVDTFLQLFGDV